jgi:hypothetical protein
VFSPPDKASTASFEKRGAFNYSVGQSCALFVAILGDFIVATDRLVIRDTLFPLKTPLLLLTCHHNKPSPYANVWGDYPSGLNDKPGVRNLTVTSQRKRARCTCADHHCILKSPEYLLLDSSSRQYSCIRRISLCRLSIMCRTVPDFSSGCRRTTVKSVSHLNLVSDLGGLSLDRGQGSQFLHSGQNLSDDITPRRLT